MGGFRPEFLGKMGSYLEALGRDHRGPDENPGIGVILCTSKEEGVVEHAMGRILPPTVVSEYRTQSIDKELLEVKSREHRGPLPERGADGCGWAALLSPPASGESIFGSCRRR